MTTATTRNKYFKSSLFFAILIGVFTFLALFQRVEDNLIFLALGIALIAGGASFFIFLRLLAFTGQALQDNTGDQSFKFTPGGITAIIVSSVVNVSIFSQSSPLYPFNYWDDANCFLTFCNAVIGGRTMYTDIYEQKGPMLYFIHIPFAAISRNSFFGFYLLEIILCVLWVIIAFKIVSLFAKPGRLMYALLLPILMLTYSSVAFYYGNSAEEVALPFLALSLYIGTKSALSGTFPSLKGAIVTGVCAGILFWIKYTFCGFFLGFVIWLIYVAVKDKKLNEIIKLALSFIGGFLAVSLTVILYLAIAGGLKDMFTAYFYNNIFLYTGESMPFYMRPVFALMLAFMKYSDNIFLFLMTVLGFVVIFCAKNRRLIGFIMCTFACSFTGIFGGGTQMFYYIFGMAEFAILGWAFVLTAARKIGEMIRNNGIRIAVLTVTCAALCVLSFKLSVSTYMIFTDKDDLPQYKFASIINSSEDKSLICFGFLDEGFFTVTDTLPQTRFFCWLNIADNYPEVNEEPLRRIRAHECEFIITKNVSYEIDGYELIATADKDLYSFRFEIETDVYYLYRRV